MKQYSMAEGRLSGSRLVYGCMNLNQVDSGSDRERLVGTAMDLGINVFDHADIYGAGACEFVFGEVLNRNPSWRDNMIIQSKCGIRFPGDTYEDEPPARYDFSYEHIIRATDGILERLGIEQLDILLLHRPDLLMEPDEVARAFDDLSSSGKVHEFGVSNFDWAQIQLLQQAIGAKLIVNQVQLSLLHAELIALGAKINTKQGFAAATGTLDYCRSKDIRLQSWSAIDRGQLFNPPQDAPENVRSTSALVHELAEARNASPVAIVLAWLLRHPAGIQPLVGTTNVDRLKQSCEADNVELSREEWYSLLERAQGASVP